MNVKYKHRFYSIVEYCGKPVLYNRVRWSVNRLFHINAWGIDVPQFEKAVELGIEGVLYEDIERKVFYYLPLEGVYKYGVRKTFRENEEEIFVPIRYWKVVEEVSYGSPRNLNTN